MGKRIWVKSLFLISVVAVANLAAMAQSQANEIVTLNGGRTVLHLGPQKNTVVPAETLPSTVVKIYSNLGPKNMAYNGGVGNGILGRNAGQPWPEAVGNGFTPTVDHVVQAIQVGLGYVAGTNEVTIALMEDANGNPGTVLHAWHASNLPPFGSCCILQTVIYKPGIPIKANTQYWVVVSPVDPNGNTYAVWDNNIGNLNGAFDNNIGSGWQGQSFQTLNAFAVYGK